MAAKNILLIADSDRNVHPLLEYLLADAMLFGWRVRVGVLFDPETYNNLKEAGFNQLEVTELKDFKECDRMIRKNDLVIAIAQDHQLLDIADSCIAHRKTLVSPSRLTRQMALKKQAAKERETLILMDCGFSPGLDHIIAKKAIDNIRVKGGIISSFKTYSGALHSETAKTDSLDLQLTEPPAEVLSWGRHNNRHLINGIMQHIPVHRLFERSEHIKIGQRSDIVAIPEGDSLYYKKIYDLDDAHTVIKGRLVSRRFQQLWNTLVRLGLTDPSSRMDMSAHRTGRAVVDSLLPFNLTGSIEERVQAYTGAGDDDIEAMRLLGLFDDDVFLLTGSEVAPSHVLLALLQQKVAMKADDKDSIVMQHHLAYELRGEYFEMEASLVFDGESEKKSALAQIIGYACGAAAKAVMLGTVKVKGLHIPIIREIYDPILNELEELGIAFHLAESRVAINASEQLV